MAKPLLVPNQRSSLPMAREVTALSGRPPEVFSLVKLFQDPFAYQPTPPSVATHSSRFSPMAKAVMTLAGRPLDVFSAVKVCQSPSRDRRTRPFLVPNHL